MEPPTHHDGDGFAFLVTGRVDDFYHQRNALRPHLSSLTEEDITQRNLVRSRCTYCFASNIQDNRKAHEYYLKKRFVAAVRGRSDYMGRGGYTCTTACFSSMRMAM